MSCQTNNATAPSPAVAPGRERIDPRQVVELLVNRHGSLATDPRLAQVAPGFDAPFFQAGLAGYSDAAMRIVARRHGCPFCVTEALLDRTLLAGGRGFTKADLGELHDNIPGGPEDHPLAGQIMGSHPREMAAGALKMAEQGIRGDRSYRSIAYDHDPELWADVIESHLRNPGGEQVRGQDHARPDVGGGVGPGDVDGDPTGGGVDGEGSWPGLAAGDGPAAAGAGASFQVIDVNLACPVKKIKNKARGGHWLTDPAGAIRILEAVRDAVPSNIPCSVKLRRAYDDTPEMADHFERIFDAAYRIGYCWATVHARTVEQKYIGPSRWTFLRDLVARHPDRIVFGSGDVWDVNDIFAMIGYTGVQAVSVARGCIGNPWIFRQARDMIAGRPPQPPTMTQQRVALEEHFRLSLAVTRKFKKAEEQSSKMMRKFAIRFAAHHPRSQDVRDRMIAVRNAAEWLGVLDEHYPAEDAAPPGR